ncbi:UDP-N-acetylmuramate:L-alanyl-gamma-D-glutamyl-meso-diaminopimelate ligase [Candidatus Magnetaquicoccus inordinatus]|uniref:UDP-N-acetylmuramate:L-alanyl-gamma-D-glutamyl- meso-diaminopimelate ligase n=1 Tax=Candidatus Magnetaquicoccus inordinatus TaxID=2496818 RepID=UPI00102CF292|nr:UDP-N-acetylmuramate:L-alanyl-gamma-D-glutamyl-meso-diaminopimelate ligase [Candidatus Magnetaquicoccus inordinatus]
MKHLHIIGICGTAMAGLAVMAKEQGWLVTGSDNGIYPPMSSLLEEIGIPLQEGFRLENLQPRPDLVLVGNTISRGNVELEAVMDQDIPYRSGAQWLYEHVLAGRHPVVATGTHGKTTTTSLLAKVWQEAGWQPGFLIGGIPLDFGRGARLPPREWVIVEGDEYDTAFFDKRPKFLHYRPKTLIINNLEFDHADIYPDLEAIRRQFRLLLRSVPASGYVLANGDDPEVAALLPAAYSRVVTYGLHGAHPFTAQVESSDGSSWQLLRQGEPLCRINWSLLGDHNVYNGLATAAAALLHGMPVAQVKAGLEGFQGVARRMQLRFMVGGVSVYDDFAHHPTAIATTLAGLRARIGSARLWVVVEPRSNTMRTRVHQERLAPAFALADHLLLARPQARGLRPEELLDVEAIVAELNGRPSRGEIPTAAVVANGQEAVVLLKQYCQPGDHVVIMSNGGFDGIHLKLQQELGQS